MPLESINPATGEKIAVYEEMPFEEIERKILAAHNAFLAWKKRPFGERGELLRRAAGILRERKDELARLMAAEMGKPLAQGAAEIEKCAGCCEYYADNAEKFLSPEDVRTEFSRSYVAYEAIGTVLAVMPWNFPFWQVFRFLAPALMAGNAGLLKHSSNVSGCALEIENVIREAGFPEGIFATLLVSSREVEKIIAHEKTAAVTLTGSTAAGRAVASAAGKYLKKAVLELGGSDAYIVLGDADIEKAAEICVYSRLINSGQSCIAAKRFIVVDEVYERFEAAFVRVMKEKSFGNPLDEGSYIGPQARHDLRDEIHSQVQRSVGLGARILCGGEIPGLPGAYYPPTALADVKKGMPAYDEEIFGPVASLIRVRDENEAVRVANDTVFGLGGAVFTGDTERGNRIAREELACGCAFVNDFVRSDPRLPFGGVKESGFGRELSWFGIREFVNIKTVVVK